MQKIPWKKVSIFVSVVGILLIGYVRTADAQAVRHWQHQAQITQENPFADPNYPLAYVLGKCNILPHRDGIDLVIRVEDDAWQGGRLIQTTTIWMERREVQIATYFFFFHTTNGREEIDLVEEVSPDLFETYCMEHAPRLPAEVRQLFYGHYDVPGEELAGR